MKFIPVFMNMVLLTALGGCLPVESESDPCACIKPVSADFAIYEKLENTFFPADTVLAGEDNEVRLNALSYDSVHTWVVNGSILSDEDYIVTMPGFDPDTHVDIEHAIYSEAHPLCYPGEDSYDTTSMSFYVTLPDESPMYGTYRGVMDFAPQDTFEFSISLINPLGLPEPKAYVQNFPNGYFNNFESDPGDNHTWSQNCVVGGSNARSAYQQPFRETFYVTESEFVKHEIHASFKKTAMKMRVSGTIRITTQTAPGDYTEEVQSYVFTGYKISQ